MTPTKFFVVAAVGLSATACSYSNTTTAAAPVPVAYRSGAEQACLDYGFNPGTDPYNRCVVREAQSRAAGRMPPDYAMARINGDARDACYSYGLTIGSAPYDRCVGREIEARRYRDQAVVTTVPASPATTVYTPTGDDRLYAVNLCAGSRCHRLYAGPGHLCPCCDDAAGGRSGLPRRVRFPL